MGEFALAREKSAVYMSLHAGLSIVGTTPTPYHPKSAIEKFDKDF
jgi:hypothetical protein